jgi:hypothetical protein
MQQHCKDLFGNDNLNLEKCYNKNNILHKNSVLDYKYYEIMEEDIDYSGDESNYNFSKLDTRGKFSSHPVYTDSSTEEDETNLRFIEMYDNSENSEDESYVKIKTKNMRRIIHFSDDETEFQIKATNYKEINCSENDFFCCENDKNQSIKSLENTHEDKCSIYPDIIYL